MGKVYILINIVRKQLKLSPVDSSELLHFTNLWQTNPMQTRAVASNSYCCILCWNWAGWRLHWSRGTFVPFPRIKLWPAQWGQLFAIADLRSSMSGFWTWKGVSNWWRRPLPVSPPWAWPSPLRPRTASHTPFPLSTYLVSANGQDSNQCHSNQYFLGGPFATRSASQCWSYLYVWGQMPPSTMPVEACAFICLSLPGLKFLAWYQSMTKTL